uniref:(northern house mosquito) hypothetical protein n=1 Tax=Culex pipiens TaxID=7175 RepID=A0A8D8E757_CULPI
MFRNLTLISNLYKLFIPHATSPKILPKLRRAPAQPSGKYAGKFARLRCDTKYLSLRLSGGGGGETTNIQSTSHHHKLIQSPRGPSLRPHLAKEDLRENSENTQTHKAIQIFKMPHRRSICINTFP